MKVNVYCYTTADAGWFEYYATEREALEAYKRDGDTGWVERLTTVDLPLARLAALLLNRHSWVTERVEIRVPRAGDES